MCKSALFVGVTSLFSVTGDGVNKKKMHMEKNVTAYCASRFNRGQNIHFFLASQTYQTIKIFAMVAETQLFVWIATCCGQISAIIRLVIQLFQKQVRVYYIVHHHVLCLWNTTSFPFFWPKRVAITINMVAFD